MTNQPSFQAFRKIPRLVRECVITEKIDGTNAQVCITEHGDMFFGSRNRWITPDDDNYGFARWAEGNRDMLMRLGPGQHFGEWWGCGVQRNYGLTEKRFSLFNVRKYAQPGATLLEGQQYPPEGCHVVPIICKGTFGDALVEWAMTTLTINGSQAAPGWMTPEGIVVFHVASGSLFKRTCENDEAPKGQVAA